MTRPGRDADAAPEQIAENLRHVSPDQLAERTLGGDRGVAKPLATSDGQGLDLLPVRKPRIQKTRGQRKRRLRRAEKRVAESKKAYRKAARYQQYEASVRQEYAHQTSHALVVNAAYDLYAFEGLPITNMTKRPKAKKFPRLRMRPRMQGRCPSG